MTAPRVIVALPAYNEDQYIADIVHKVKKHTDTVVVVDDGSTDGTAWRATDAGAYLIQHTVNKGYGSAIQSILTEVGATNFDVLVIIDADEQHSPDDIPALVVAVLNGYDLAIGSRKGSDVPAYRRLGGTILSIFTYFLSNRYVKDSQCGFRAYSKQAVDMIRLQETGMAVSSEIIYEATKHELRIVEVPISVRYTDDSSTHNPIKQGFYTLWRILVMMAKDEFRR